MLRSVSLGSPSRALACLDARSPGEKPSSGGSTHNTLKKENGARLGCPDVLSVETHAIGRGATEFSKRPYSSLCEIWEGITSIIVYLSWLQRCYGNFVRRRRRARGFYVGYVKVLGEYFLRRHHSIAVNRDRIFHILRIASGECDHHRKVACPRHAEHQFVAPFQPLDRQIQPAKLIFAIGIGARHVAQQIRLKLPQAGAERVIEPGQIIRISATVGQVDVN